MRVVVITGVVAMICTVLEILYEDKLEDTSADFIAWLQEGSSPGLDLIFGLLELFTGGIFVFISAMLYMCGNRKLGIMGLIAGILAASTASLLKMSFSHPRPF